MKKFVIFFMAMIAGAGVSALTQRNVEAYPGAMCFNSDSCGRCEVCVKREPFDPSGECMRIAGCY